MNDWVVPTLPPGMQIHTEMDRVHWTPETAMAMVSGWLSALDLRYETHLGQSSGTVINLSKTIVLTRADLSLLQKGLTFIPRQPERNMPELQVRASAYHRRLRLAAFFGPETTSEVSRRSGNRHYKKFPKWRK